jgi:hypothetical protein
MLKDAILMKLFRGRDSVLSDDRGKGEQLVTQRGAAVGEADMRTPMGARRPWLRPAAWVMASVVVAALAVGAYTFFSRASGSLVSYREPSFGIEFQHAPDLVVTSTRHEIPSGMDGLEVIFAKSNGTQGLMRLIHLAESKSGTSFEDQIHTTLGDPQRLLLLTSCEMPPPSFECREVSNQDAWVNARHMAVETITFLRGPKYITGISYGQNNGFLLDNRQIASSIKLSQ